MPLQCLLHTFGTFCWENIPTHKGTKCVTVTLLVNSLLMFNDCVFSLYWRNVNIMFFQNLHLVASPKLTSHDYPSLESLSISSSIFGHEKVVINGLKIYKDVHSMFQYLKLDGTFNWWHWYNSTLLIRFKIQVNMNWIRKTSWPQKQIIKNLRSSDSNQYPFGLLVKILIVLTQFVSIVEEMWICTYCIYILDPNEQ